MQIQLVSRYKSGFTLQASYTYQVAKFTNGDSYAFLYDRKLGYGNRDWTSHNTFTAAENWEIPFGKGKRWGHDMSRVADTIIGGWALNGVTIWYSGVPFTPGIGTFPSGAIRPYTGPSDRPDKGNVDPFKGALGDRRQRGPAARATRGDPYADRDHLAGRAHYRVQRRGGRHVRQPGAPLRSEYP